jgi:hypothetical protein
VWLFSKKLFMLIDFHNLSALRVPKYLGQWILF